MNLIRLPSAAAIREPAEALFAGRAVRLAVTGYTLAPNDDYYAGCRDCLDEVATIVPSIGYETSSSAIRGSVDAATTWAAFRRNVPLLYLTAEHDVQYIVPEKFPPEIDIERFLKVPKYVIPNGSPWNYTYYSQATALATNRLAMLGGRDAAVNDFTEAVRNGNRVVLVDDPAWGPVGWDAVKSRPNNGTRYVIEQTEAALAGKSLPYAPVRGFTERFLCQYSREFPHLIQVVHQPVERAAPEIAAFITGV